MAATREAPALYPKLTPGPGKSAEEVAFHQRARLYGAMIEIAGERGYAAVTVRELTRLAGVSTRAFYKHFEDKEDCFLQAYDLIAREAAARVLSAQRREGCDWMRRLRAGSHAYALELERHPQAARLAFVEALAAGPAALKRTRGAECVFEALIAESLGTAPDGVTTPAILVEGIAAGVEGVARSRLIAGRERELSEMVDELLQWALNYRGEDVVEIARLDGRSTSVLASGPAKANGKVLSDERERILSAVAKLAAADGYQHLTVPRIRSEAGVSRRCFDTHFENVGDCFLASLKSRVERALSYSIRAASSANTWANGVHRAIFTLCTLAASDQTLAKLAFVEVFAPGPEGVRCRERLMAKTTELFRESAPPHQRPGELAAEASVNAIWGIVHHRVVAGRAHQLPRLSPALSLLALAPAIGTQAAADAVSEDIVLTAGASASSGERLK